MNLTISPKAQKWFTKELELESGDSIRFFGKYGGSTNVHTGFTTGMQLTKPSNETLAQIKAEDILFFVDETDDWFFQGYDLAVDYDETIDEPTYFYTETDATE